MKMLCSCFYYSFKLIQVQGLPAAKLDRRHEVTRVSKANCWTFHIYVVIYHIAVKFVYIHTYIIGHYNSSVRIIDLMLCVLILYISGGPYSLKSTLNDRFLRNFSWQFYYRSEFLPEICWEEENRRRNTFRILFWCLAWDSNPAFLSNKPTHYLLDHGDFKS